MRFGRRWQVDHEVPSLKRNACLDRPSLSAPPRLARLRRNDAGRAAATSPEAAGVRLRGDARGRASAHWIGRTVRLAILVRVVASEDVRTPYDPALIATRRALMVAGLERVEGASCAQSWLAMTGQRGRSRCSSRAVLDKIRGADRRKRTTSTSRQFHNLMSGTFTPYGAARSSRKCNQ